MGRGYALDTADFEKAYLNAPIDGKVFMILDADTTRVLLSLYLKSGKSYVPFLDDKDRMIVMVNKAIYGLQQSALLWNKQPRSLLSRLVTRRIQLIHVYFTINKAW